MKYFGSILDFTEERNKELIRVYNEKLKQADYIIMPEIFKQVANSPCSRFWVSEERAAVVMSAMLVGKPLLNMTKNKREMFEDLFQRFLMLREKYPKKPICSLSTMAVYQPAPKFYMTPRTIGELIYRIKSGWYDRQYNRYKDCRTSKDSTK